MSAGPRPLRGDLDRLETAAGTDVATAVESLVSLGDPRRATLLLEVALTASLRRGPGGRPSPSRWIEVGAAAAAAGAVPWGTPGELRRRLLDASQRLVASSAWSSDAPAWWDPLPAASEGEGRWEEVAAGLRWPQAPAWAGAFRGGPRYLVMESFVGEDFAAEAFRELETFWGAGASALEPGTVGDARRSADRSGPRSEGHSEGHSEGRTEGRSDDVRFVTGLEGDLLAAAPSATVLIQALLAGVEGWMGEISEGRDRSLYPPQRAMLARYGAPGQGFDPHLDNPAGGAIGGDFDNGRGLTLVVYLNPRHRTPCGGELALWRPGASSSDPADAVVPPVGGGAACFDSRRVLHQVRPLEPGPPRWALTLWLNEAPQGPPPSLPVPMPTVAELLAPVADPPLPARKLLARICDDYPPPVGGAGLGVDVWAVPQRASVRAGVVTTAYGADLSAWGRRHLDLGFQY
ncbi:MAG: 2OG-Fe(II) oxygenase, partial [Acidobacteriota bacterium]